MSNPFQQSLEQRGLAVASAIALTGDGVPEWVMIFPAGTSMGADGRGPYVLSNPLRVIAASLKDARPVPFDYNHQTVFAVTNGGEARASGWINAMEVRDGAIWAKVDWTEAASKAIAAKEYRFVSPTFQRDLQTGEVFHIESVALVNTPNLTELPAIASKTGVNDMDKLLSALREALGLPADADQDAIIAACKSSRATCSSLDTVKTLAPVLKLDASTASVSDIVTAAKSAITSGGKPDPAQFVPMAAFAELQTTVASLQANHVQTQTETLVTAAVQAGKVSPALKEWATDYASKNPAGFKAWEALAPVIVTPQTTASTLAGVPPGTLTTADDGTVREICANLGIPVEAYRKTEAEKQGERA